MDKNEMSSFGMGPINVIIILIISGVFITVHYFTYPLFSINIIPSIVFYALAGFFILLGIIIWLGAILAFLTVIRQKKLATTCSYAFVRHPIYAGVLYIVIGGLLIFRSYILLPLPFVFYFITRYFTKIEERYCIKKFGSEYEDYMKRVNALIPTLFKK